MDNVSSTIMTLHYVHARDLFIHYSIEMAYVALCVPVESTTGLTVDHKNIKFAFNHGNFHSIYWLIILQ